MGETLAAPALVGRQAAALLAAGGAGRVLGAFSAGLYIEAAGRVLAVYHRRYGALSFGIGVADVEAVLKRAGAEAGDALALEGNGLFFPGSGFRLVLGREAEAPRAALPPLPAAEIARRLAEARALLARQAAPNGLAGLALGREGAGPLWNPLCDKAVGPMNDLLAALALGDEGEDEAAVGKKMAQALARLVGLGAGLTPSADDALAGMACALHALARLGLAAPPGAGMFFERLAKAAPARTGKISAAYLLAAAAGERLELPERALEALLCLPDGAALPAAAGELLALGSSSGGDMLAGILTVLSSGWPDLWPKES